MPITRAWPATPSHIRTAVTPADRHQRARAGAGGPKGTEPGAVPMIKEFK